MTELFLTTVNLSYQALWIVAAVLLLRQALRKAPRWSHVLLWGLVALRLLLPVTVESTLSLQPSAQMLTVSHQAAPVLHTGFAAVNRAAISTAAEQQRDWLPILAAVWLAGAAVMGIYAAVSYGLLRRRLRDARKLEVGVLICHGLESVFVLGLLRPVIYLPEGLSPQETVHVLAHERAHIRRRDHLWKPLGFFLLAVHWFNPALWLAYVLLCRDIELACDERVIRELGPLQRADYSQTILRQSMGHRTIAACPLAFGEAGAKTRVRHILSWKKPGFWIILLAILAAGIAGICLLTTPKREDQSATPDGILWLDYWDTPGELDECETTRPEFPGVTFRYTGEQVIAENEIGHTILMSGMPIWNVFFYDLTGDGLPELCATVSYGSGIIDEHVVVVDYATGAEYTLWDRGVYDYRLRLSDGVLICDQRPYGEKTVVQSGPLTMEHGIVALAGQYAVLENGLAADGQAIWQRFREAARRGETAAVRLVCDYNELPEPVVRLLSFDGSTYRLQWEEDGGVYDRELEYLMVYETQAVLSSETEPVTVTHYVLTHDRTVTWEQLWQSTASSVAGAYIEHMEVWAEIQ